LEQNGTTRPQRISSALAAAQAQSALATSVRFPGEDGGQSLAEMAQRDLDAALQLLADRAQYITGASGAAIALRRDGMADMLCRASTGTNAPELGALLSTEFGLSGESVRTKRALRCDDAERDARVNHEVCRQLGIASVVVMPVVNDDQVLGVFELFSGKANAFGERDLSAIQRLSQMVETAVRLAEAGAVLPKKRERNAGAASIPSKSVVQEGQFIGDLLVDRKLDQPVLETSAPAVAAEAGRAVAAAKSEPKEGATPEAPLIAAPKKPLFWSAALSPEVDSEKPADSEESHVPPVLRGLRKCEACGFPVSAGRALCVECEEKKWRGQLRPQAARTAAVSSPSGSAGPAAAAPAMAKAVLPVVEPKMAQKVATPTEPPKSSGPVDASSATVVDNVASQQPAAGVQTSVPDFVLSAGLEPSRSWLASNKYILIVLFVAAAGAAAVFFLR
jgi:GAF domain-containing protein